MGCKGKQLMFILCFLPIDIFYKLFFAFINKIRMQEDLWGSEICALGLELFKIFVNKFNQTCLSYVVFNSLLLQLLIFFSCFYHFSFFVFNQE